MNIIIQLYEYSEYNGAQSYSDNRGCTVHVYMYMYIYIHDMYMYMYMLVVSKPHVQNVIVNRQAC